MRINKPIISPHQKEKIELVKLTYSMSRAEKEKALTKALIRQGWKLVEDKQMGNINDDEVCIEYEQDKLIETFN